jgi:hypothetical protein
MLLAICSLLFAGLFAAYWYLPKATVTLTVAPKPLAHQFDLTADSTVTDIAAEGSVLPAALAQITVTTHKTRPATGTKLIGDRAAGEVTIINGTSTERSFPAGTTISSPSGLKFTLTSSVTIASASGTADPNSYQPGKATVKITAVDIGPDANLTAGTQFKIGSFSFLDYVAKNDSAFVGGSSRQVAAVSKDDLSAL